MAKIGAKFHVPQDQASGAAADEPQQPAGGQGGVDRAVPDYRVKVNGAPLSKALLNNLYSIEIHQTLSMASMAILTFDNPHAVVSDATEVNCGTELELEIGWLGQLVPGFKGEIVGIDPVFPLGASPTCTVRAYDRMHRMRRGRQQRTFTEQKVTDIVNKIASEEGLTPEVEDTQVVAKYILQNNQSNVEFLKELARRYHCEVMVDGPNKKLVLRKPKSDQGEAATVKWGHDLKSFYVKASVANMPTQVSTSTWDVTQKKAVLSTAQATHGSLDTSPGIIDMAKKFGDAKKHIINRPTADSREAKAIAESTLNEAGMDGVQGRGTCVGNTDLAPGTVLLIEGLGKSWTGKYYITAVTHLFHRTSGFSTEFEVQRNGIGNTPIQQVVDPPTPPPEERPEEEEAPPDPSLDTKVKHGEGPSDGGTATPDQPEEEEPEEVEEESAPPEEAPEAPEGETVVDAAPPPEQPTAAPGGGGGAQGDDAMPTADPPPDTSIDAVSCYIVDLLTGDHGHPSWYDKPGSGSDTKEEVQKNLQAWMTKVAEKQKTGATATVSWGAAPSSASTTDTPDLYVNITSTDASKFGATFAKQQAKSGVNGATQIKNGKVLCEVWPGTIDHGAGIPKLITRLSQLIFHEWMHFKLDIDPGAGDVVHQMGGLGKVPIDENSPGEPSDGDITSVAENLGKKKYKFGG